MNKEKLVLFLINYFQYTPDNALDFVEVQPDKAMAIAKQWTNTLLEDNTITQETKNKIQQEWQRVIVNS
jgi:hypothetical protein